MTTLAQIDAFLDLKRLALVGASRTGKKFGNSVLKELAAKDYDLYPVHREVEDLEGLRCFRSLADLPDDVQGVVIVTPKAVAADLLREAADAGINHLWLQQGSDTPEALDIGRERGLDVIHGECILMFAEPTHWFHRLHRGLWGMLGKLPE